MQTRHLLILFSTTAFSLVQNFASAQRVHSVQKVVTTQGKVDSTFVTNIASIRNKLKRKQPLSREEFSFVYVLGYMSSIDFHIASYAGTPLLTDKDLSHFEEWYQANRSRIEWKNMQRGLALMNSPATDATAKGLDSLKIK